MSKFATKVRDALNNFHLPQPGVGPGVGGQHGGVGANEYYTSDSGHRRADNPWPVSANVQGKSISIPAPPSSSANGRASTSTAS
jgi:hypothetical protein